MIIKYIILVLFSTIIGAISGLGGGVIIKPFMDLFGDYDALTISALTSFIVLSMAVISVIKQSLNKKDVKLDIKNTALLGIGSVAGGYLGQIVLEALVNAFSDSSVKIVQNILMIIMVVVIFLYFIYKDRVKNLKLKHFLFFIFGGIFLGMFATVLGIGGGPLNVVLLMVMFDMNIKTAVVGSLVTKLFSQLSKLLTMALSAGFAAADLTLLPYLIAAAIIGAYLGSVISKKCSDRAVGHYHGRSRFYLSSCHIQYSGFGLRKGAILKSLFYILHLKKVAKSSQLSFRLAFSNKNHNISINKKGK